ncbi:hypothetical protein TNCV_408221 [Trichonephila clavipes]|nr:hypothetical protein TNCV_408221 [Trichonephila clavipes]
MVVGVGLRAAIECPRTSRMCSMGLRSEDIAGQSNRCSVRQKQTEMTAVYGNISPAYDIAVKREKEFINCSRIHHR